MSYIVPRDKPKRCTQPKCRFMDRNTLDCRLQGKSWESFEEQYEHCPLIEIHTPPAEPMVDIRDTQYNLPIGTDTISRQAAIDALRAMQTYKLFAGDDMLLIDQAGAQTELMVLPPAQPKRINGRWVEKPHVHGVAYCSLCDYELHTNDTNFCPNCGADMREVTE